MQLIIHTDGGARGNPGPAAIGVAIDDATTHVHIARFGKTIGHATNNVAEYTAVIEAFKYLAASAETRNLEPESITFYLDSLLVVNQLNGLFKIKEPHLRQLLMEIRQLEQGRAGRITYRSVPREQNKVADLLVNQALDAELS